jgi:hypothetical protein
LDQENLKIH